MHEHRLAPGQAGPCGECEIDSQIVEQQSGAGLEADVIGQREHPFGGENSGLGHGTAEHRQAQHPIAGFDVRTLRGLPHHTRQFGAEGERQLGAVLIQPPGQQCIGKRHPGGMDLDDDAAVGGGFVNLN